MSGAFAEWHSKIFSARYMRLYLRLLIIREKDPATFLSHPETKFFKQLRSRMDVALADPEAPEYLLGDFLSKQRPGGKTLGKGYSAWRRIKNGMPDRYRLFFQFSSEERELIFAWLNDQRSIRREDHKNDVYAVFAKLLASDAMPTAYKALRAKSSLHTPAPAEKRLRETLN